MAALDGVLDLVRRWAAAEQQNDAGLLADDFAGVGPLGFVLTRDAEPADPPLSRDGHADLPAR